MGWVCVPNGIVEPVHRIRKPIWKPIGVPLLEITNRDISASGISRPNDVLNTITQNLSTQRGPQAIRVSNESTTADGSF